jgi:DNA-directed RNA polymerase subunit M/transcription elongation factor TFIIS
MSEDSNTPEFSEPKSKQELLNPLNLKCRVCGSSQVGAYAQSELVENADLYECTKCGHRFGVVYKGLYERSYK